jgi:hypothetical protein
MYMPAARKTGKRLRNRNGRFTRNVRNVRNVRNTRKTKTNLPPQKKTLLIGKMYANWCGHCNTLKPEWAKMEGEIRQMPQMRHIAFIAIEESEKNKLNKFKSNPKYASLTVSGYPTIFSHNGQGFNYYRGQRDANSLKQWVMNGGK